MQHENKGKRIIHSEQGTHPITKKICSEIIKKHLALKWFFPADGYFGQRITVPGVLENHMLHLNHISGTQSRTTMVFLM